MIKNLLIMITVLLFLSGCGSGPSDEATDSTLKLVKQKETVKKDYNLWEYMTPSSDKINSFSLYYNDASEASETYTTSYTVSVDSVEEVSSYSPNEKTVYSKKEDEIKISFLNNDSSMGFFTINLQANIGDTITKKESSCKLTEHYPTYAKEFNDVLEIVCGEQHGFYQKGVGEIAQVAQNETSKEVRMLSN